MLQTFSARFGRDARPVAARTPPVQKLDEAHGAVWEAVRHLFPSHAMVNQCDQGMLLVSWALPGGRASHFAAPLLIRIDPALLQQLWRSEGSQRKVIARLQERSVRAALAGYDPGARVPTAPMIELGSEVFA